MMEATIEIKSLIRLGDSLVNLDGIVDHYHHYRFLSKERLSDDQLKEIEAAINKKPLIENEGLNG